MKIDDNIARHYNLTDEDIALTMIDIPVLIMAGGKPILYDNPEDFKVNAKKALPDAEVIIVPGAGHGLNMEKPEFVNKKIIEFLSDNQ